MISNIVVEGFRSLSALNLEIRPGLNILVGPNGSGKTNIIEFFQFLSFLMRYDLSRAISMSGGAGSVFRKLPTGVYDNSIHADIHGNVRSLVRSRYEKSVHIKYIYSFSIKASEALDQVYFSAQQLKIFIEHYEDANAKQTAIAWTSFANEPDWDLDVALTYDHELRPRVIIGAVSERLTSLESLSNRFLPGKLRRDSDTSDPVNFIKTYYEDRGSAYSNIIDISSFIFDSCESITSDIVGGEILNIVPWRVKQPEDSAAPQGIRSDGSGLAATLYSFERRSISQAARRSGRHYVQSVGPTRPGIDRITFRQIEQYLQLVNPTIARIKVKNDPFDNRIKMSFHVKSDGSSIELPISAMSDGTLKWLALITAILTYRSIFAIEEPENFLHPLMQQEIIKIMREDTMKREGESFVIMTTHSETLLNVAEPEEIVVVAMLNGSTQTIRIQDPDLLRMEIAETGFGIGFYYTTGALDNA